MGFFFATSGSVASRFHRDNVGCPIPTSRDSWFAETAPRSLIFATSFALNLSEYGTGFSAFSPPTLTHQQRRQLP
jgi:hypothetical protein